MCPLFGLGSACRTISVIIKQTAFSIRDQKYNALCKCSQVTLAELNMIKTVYSWGTCHSQYDYHWKQDKFM